jgi:hypothetical protein
MASLELIRNIETARKELAKAVATNYSRKTQRKLLQQGVCKLTKHAS